MTGFHFNGIIRSDGAFLYLTGIT